MKKPVVTLPLQTECNGKRIPFSKKLIAINLLLTIASILFFVPTPLLVNGIQTILHQLAHINSIVLVWIAVNIIVSIAAIIVHARVSRIKNTLESLPEVEEEISEPANSSNDYLCIKVSGSKNIIWLNGDLFDLGKNDMQRLVASSTDISFTSLSN